MQYTFTHEPIGEGMELCVTRADGFRTACVTATFRLPLGDEAALFALLPGVLTHSCEKYPSMAALEKKLALLYGAEITDSVTKSGEDQVIAVGVSCIDDRFALDGEPIVASCAELLMELLFRPLLKDGAFDPDTVESEKRMLCERLDAEKSDKRLYAAGRCEQIMCADEAYGLNRLGTREAIRAVTPAALTEAYRTLLREAPVFFSVAGSGGADGLKALIADYTRGLSREIVTGDTVYVERAEDVTDVRETEPVKQGKLVLGFRAGMTGPGDNYSARRVMVDLFGGGVSSKLFRNVREKQSLCYYCSARLYRRKGIILVQSGIETSNEQVAREAILAELQAVRDGDFTDDDIAACVKSLEDGFRSVEDSPEALDLWFVSQRLIGENYTPEEFVRGFRAVTRDEIIAAARDVTLDTVFMLASSGEGGEQDA